MNWTWQISFGQAVLTVPLIFIVLTLFRIYSMLLMFRIEHEYLIQDWCTRTGTKLADLPTRQRRWW